MTQTLADLLILFTPGARPGTGRLGQSIWQPFPQAEGAWFQPSSSGWKGFPLRIAQAPGWQIFLLGETDSWQLPTLLTEAEITHQVCQLSGSFLLFAYHQTSQTWHTWTDRFGTLHAYHAWDGQRAALGTFSPAIAARASQRQLDWEALAAWFAFGFFPADRTHYKNVRILRPASHYVFDRDGRNLLQERYWRWHHEPDAQRSYADTVAEFGEVFRQVMADALADGRVALPLSGGLDSRSTLATVTPELAANGNIWAYSYGYGAHSVETKIAHQLAAVRKLPFQAFTIQPYLFDQMGALLAYTEGFQDITQARQMFVLPEIETHADTLIAALWGDVWLDEMGLSKQPLATERQVLHHTLKKITKPAGWLLTNLALPQLRLASAPSLLESFVQAELQPLAHLADPDFRVKAYKTEQWSFRWSIPPTRVFQSTVWPRKVFYDTRLADFFATVSTAHLVERRLQIDYLKQFAPDLACIPWQVYDADLYHYQLFNTWLLPKRAVKKAWRLLKRQSVLERNWEVQFLNSSGHAGLEHWLLRPGLKLHDLVSSAVLQILVNSFFAAPLVSGAAYPLSMLLTFSAWLEEYG